MKETEHERDSQIDAAGYVCRFLEPVQTRFTEKGPGVCREQPPGLEKRRATRHQLLTKLLLVVDRASLAARHVRAHCVCKKGSQVAAPPLDRIMSLKTQLAPTLLARTTTGPRFAWQRPRLRPIDARARSGRTGLPPRSKDRLASRGSPPARGVARREAGRRAVTGPDRTATRQRHCSSVRHGRDTSRRHEREGAQFCQRSAHATPADAQMGRNCHEVHDELMKDGPHVKAFRLTQLWPKSMPVQGGNPIHLPLNF